MKIRNIILLGATLALMGQGCSSSVSTSVNINGAANDNLPIFKGPNTPPPDGSVNAGVGANAGLNLNTQPLLNLGLNLNAMVNDSGNKNKDMNANTPPTPPVTVPAPPQPAPAPTPITESFTVEADDSGFYPATIKVTKGDTVKITFKVRTDNVYFGGLRIISGDLFNTGALVPGGSNTVQFKATSNVTFSSYWPSSGVHKADGTVIIK